MQLPEKNKENFDVSNDDPRNFPTKPKGLRSKCRSFTCIFQVVASLSIRNFLIIGTTYTDTATPSKIYTGRHLMDHSPINQNFELNKSRQKFHHSLKEHLKISNIPKFRCKML
jgi:hypothetical protein